MLDSRRFTHCLDTPGWIWNNPEKSVRTGQAPSSLAAALPWVRSGRGAPGAARLPSLPSSRAPSLPTTSCRGCKAHSAGAHVSKMGDNSDPCSCPRWKGRRSATIELHWKCQSLLGFFPLLPKHKHFFTQFFDQISFVTEGKMPVVLSEN